MKLRTAYFCRNCDEEVDLKKTVTQGECRHCGFSRKTFNKTIVYEWKVEAVPAFKKHVDSFILDVEYGDSCPVTFVDGINEKVEKPNEKVNAISTQRRKVSNR